MAINQLQRGSTLERKAWMARVRRVKKKWLSQIVAEAMDSLIQYGRDRETRTGRKKRGL